MILNCLLKVMLNISKWQLTAKKVGEYRQRRRTRRFTNLCNTISKDEAPNTVTKEKVLFISASLVIKKFVMCTRNMITYN